MDGMEIDGTKEGCKQVTYGVCKGFFILKKWQCYIIVGLHTSSLGS
jgi:hypothetical protein